MITTITLNPAIDTRYFIDDFQEGKLFRADKIVKSPGGKGLNVTKVLHQLGADVTATGIVGGKNGEWIREKLKERNIKEKFYICSKETRVCIAVLAKNSETEILEASEEVEEKDIKGFEKVFAELLEKSDIITISGSLLKGVEKDYYKKLIEMINSKNRKVILDTSGATLLEGIKAKPYLIKPNFDELEYITGEKISDEHKLKGAVLKLKESGAQNILVSMGKDGAMYFGERNLKVTIPEIEVCNTVGSGDSTVAGFAKGLQDNMDLEETLKLAMACGMSNAQKTETGLVDIKDVESFMKQIKIEEIKL